MLTAHSAAAYLRPTPKSHEVTFNSLPVLAVGVNEILKKCFHVVPEASWAWWGVPAVLVLGKGRQEESTFETGLAP